MLATPLGRARGRACCIAAAAAPLGFALGRHRCAGSRLGGVRPRSATPPCVVRAGNRGPGARVWPQAPSGWSEETTACPFLAQEASGSARRGPLLVTALRTPGFWSLLSPELGMVALEQKGQATGTPAGPRRGPDQRLPAGSAQAPEWWRRLLGVALPGAPGTQHQELGSAGVSQLRGGGGTPPTMGASQCVHGGVCADGGVQR